MNPQQPTPQPPQNSGSEYDFFLNPASPTKRRPLSGGLGSGNTSRPMRIAMIVGLVFVVILLLYFILAIATGGSTDTNTLTAVAQEQSELVRVANLGTAQAGQQTTLNFAQSASLSLATDQQQLLAFLQQRNIKLSPNALAATKDTNTDQQLNAATQSSTFDQTFINIMQAQLNTYQTSLKNAYTRTTSAAEKQLLSGEYTDAGLLLKELHSPGQ